MLNFIQSLRSIFKQDKFSNTTFSDMICQAIEYSAQTIIENSSTDITDYNESLCEIKVYLWAISADKIYDRMGMQEYTQALDCFIDRSLFSSIDSKSRKYRIETNFAFDRIDYYDKNIETSPQLIEKFHYIWFVKPFATNDDIDNFSIQRASMQTHAFISVAPMLKNYIPLYLEIVDKICDRMKQ